MLSLFLFLIPGLVLADFMELEGGVRTKGMGGAFTGIADDINAIYYNPAGLGQFQKGEVYLCYNNYYNLDLLTSFILSVATPGIAEGTIGFSYKKVGVGDKVNFLNNYNEAVYNLSYGLEVADSIYIGANAKFLKITYDVRASAIGYDVGALFRTFEKHLSVGLMLKNINKPTIRWENGTKEELEQVIRIGAGIRPNNDLLLGVDLDGVNQENYNIHAGGEMWFFNRLVAPRIGLAYLQSDGLSLNAGASLQYKYLRVDYTLEKHYELGYDHLFGVLIKF